MCTLHIKIMYHICIYTLYNYIAHNYKYSIIFIKRKKKYRTRFTRIVRKIDTYCSFY